MNERVEHRKLDINYYSETKSYIEDFKYFVFEKKKEKEKVSYHYSGTKISLYM